MPQQLISPSTVYPICGELLPSEEIREGAYVVRYASTEEELDELLRLRFEVFNLELGEGLDASYETGRDRDEFDDLCHHLTVVERVSGAIIGTYRIQRFLARGGFALVYLAVDPNGEQVALKMGDVAGGGVVRGQLISRRQGVSLARSRQSPVSTNARRLRRRTTKVQFRGDVRATKFFSSSDGV